MTIFPHIVQLVGYIYLYIPTNLQSGLIHFLQLKMFRGNSFDLCSIPPK